MGIDIRFPVGLMFGILGIMLWAFGWLGDRSIYSKSLGIDINLVWGAVLFFFGLIMVVLAWRARRKASTEGTSAPFENTRAH